MQSQQAPPAAELIFYFRWLVASTMQLTLWTKAYG